MPTNSEWAAHAMRQATREGEDVDAACDRLISQFEAAHARGRENADREFRRKQRAGIRHDAPWEIQDTGRPPPKRRRRRSHG